MADRHELDPITVPGVVRLRGNVHYIPGVLAEWILDYRSYDPAYDPAEWQAEFRAGLLTVSPDDGDAYLRALQSHEIPPTDLGEHVARGGVDRTRPAVLVDFDAAEVTSGYYDVAVEEYAGEGWRGTFADPVERLPMELQELWADTPR